MPAYEGRDAKLRFLGGIVAGQGALLTVVVVPNRNAELSCIPLFSGVIALDNQATQRWPEGTSWPTWRVWTLEFPHLDGLYRSVRSVVVAGLHRRRFHLRCSSGRNRSDRGG